MGNLASRKSWGVCMVGPTLFDAAQSRLLRDKGIEQAGSWPANEWVSKARAFAVSYARVHGTVDMDVVSRHCPRPADISPAASGAVFKTKELVVCGTKNSDKVSSHARRICIYKIREKQNG